MDVMQKPFVSIIIPCLNESKFIASCLESLLKNDYPSDRLEILVIDGLSSDGTRKILDEFHSRDARIRLLDNPKKITPIALNIGIRNAKGDIILRMDAHASIEANYVSKCVESLEKYQADNVGGIMMTIPRDPSLLANSIVATLSHPFGVGNSHFRIHTKEPRWVDTVFGGCYRREVFDRIGLYNEQLACSQDIELNIRLKKAGGKILLDPGIVSYYFARSDFPSFCRHNFRNGMWAILPFGYSSVVPVSWRHLIPLAFVLSLLVSAFLSLTTSFGVYLLAAIGGSYLMADLGASLQIAKSKKNPAYALTMPFMFFCLHSMYGLGSFAALCKLAKIFFLKRAFDVLFSSFGTLIWSPVLAYVALRIKLEDGGPVFYRGVRVGFRGKTFRIFKFRSMVINAEKIGGPSTADDDPRITKIGKLIRKYKLDELPQLFNVFVGDMSLVGPRPEVKHYTDMYTEEEKAILTVRPGITDWASLWNSDEGALLAGSKDPEKDYLEKIRPEKIRLQLKYVRERSFWTDLKILWLTFAAVALRPFGKGSEASQITK